MRNLKSIFFLLTLLMLGSTKSFGQVNKSQNGITLSAHGEIRILTIFVEIDYIDRDSLDKSNTDTEAIWPEGGLPNWKDDLLDTGYVTNYSGSVTNYFADASFGEYEVYGDYIDSIFTIPDTGLGGPITLTTILSRLREQLNGYSFQTKNNLPYSKFDLWQNSNVEGGEKVNIADNPGSIDHIMILIRNFHGLGPQAGGVTPASFSSSGTWKSDSYSRFSATLGNPVSIVVHEFGHLLYGGNNFHTVGRGAGTWRTLYPTGGVSGMGSESRMNVSFNAWDRRRLGWKPQNKTMFISAYEVQNAGGVESLIEVNSDLTDADDVLSNDEFLLRDFLSTGDALRIKLPYLNSDPANSNVSDQWLWIENRQNTSGSDYDLKSKAAKGIYAYIQVGKDDTLSFGDLANYLHFLPATGSYDLEMSFDTVNGLDTIGMVSEKNNPFTGYHHLMQPAVDFDEDDLLERRESYNEFFWPAHLTRNGVLQDTSQMVGGRVTDGTFLDAFRDENGWRKIGIGYNPSSTPILTYRTGQTTVPNPNAASSDNRIIHLNGISIEVIEARQNGDIIVKVKFDDYDVVNDLRWCGDIVLRDQVVLKPHKTLTIDQGYMPQKPVSPQTINGEKVFADKTTFTTVSGSRFTLESNSELVIQGESTFNMEGGILEINDSAVVTIKENSFLILDDSSNLQIEPGGVLIIENGSELIVKGNDATIALGSFRAVPSSPTTSNPAEIQVYGKLTFDQTDWILDNKDGFYNFFNGHTLSIDSGYKIDLKGVNTNTKILEVSNGDLDLRGHDVYFDNGKIELLNSVSRIFTGSAKVDMEDIDLKGGTIVADGVSSFDALRFDVSYADTGFHIKNIPSTSGNIKVHYTDFTYTGMAIVAEDVYELQVNDVTSTDNCIFAKNTEIVRFKGDISSAEAGISLVDVQACYITANTSDLSFCDTAVKAVNSLVFIRNGAKLNNNVVGVYAKGEYDETENTYTTMVTVGDVGCGEIRDNSDYSSDRPITGNDFILNIDAELHAAVGGNSENINPNSFQNNRYFEICYGDKIYAPDTIHAKSNYWDSQNYAIYQDFEVCTSAVHCGLKCYSILMDTTRESTCEPTGTGCYTCGTRGKSGLTGLDQSIFNSFHDAYEQFALTDNYTNRNGFSTVADIDLLKDTTENLWRGVDAGGDTSIISNESVHLVQVAKVIFAAKTAPPGARLKAPKPSVQTLDTEIDDDFSVLISPNPSEGFVVIETNQNSTKPYVISVYDIKGQIIIEQVSFINQIKLDASKFGDKGIYIVEVFDTDSNLRATEKLILK